MFENKRDRFLGCGDAIAKRDLGIAFWGCGNRFLGCGGDSEARPSNRFLGSGRAIAQALICQFAFWECGGAIAVGNLVGDRLTCPIIYL
jgi:hypothetical protein